MEQCGERIVRVELQLPDSESDSEEQEKSGRIQVIDRKTEEVITLLLCIACRFFCYETSNLLIEQALKYRRRRVGA